MKLLNSVFIASFCVNLSLQASVPKTTLAAKKPKVLFIGLNNAMVDAIAIDKQFDMDIRICDLGSARHSKNGSTIANRAIHYPEVYDMTKEEAEVKILADLDLKPDVIIMTMRPPWLSYPQKVRDKIIKQITDGASLITFQKKQYLSTKIEQTKLKKLPPIPSTFKHLNKDRYKVEIYGLGRGKIAFIPNMIDYRLGFAGPSVKRNSLYNYQLGRFAHLIYSLAIKKDLILSKFAVNSDLQAVLSFSTSFTGHVELWAYGPEDSLWKHLCKKSNASRQLTLDLGDLPNGENVVFCRLFNDKKQLVDWGGDILKFDQGYGIEALTSQNTVLKNGDKFEIIPKYYGQLPGNLTAELELIDSRDRILAVKSFAKAPEKVTITIPDTSTSVVNHAILSLLDVKKVICLKKLEFTLPEKRPTDFFYFMLWNGSVGNFARHRQYFKQLKNCGVDGFTNIPTRRSPIATVSACNMLSIPYTSNIHNLTLDEHLFNPEWIDKMKAKAKDTANNQLPYGSFAFTLGDEPYVSPFKKGGRFVDKPEIWQAFQEYLKTIYPSLDALNQQWEKTYDSWGKVRFKSEYAMLKNRENPSPWVDFRGFVSHRFIDHQKQLRDIIKGICPDAYVGWDGAEQYSSYDGIDLWEYVSEFDLNNVYARYLVPVNYPGKIFNGHCLRSFSKSKNLKTCWFNSINYPLGSQYTPWFMLFNGYNGAFWFHATFRENRNLAAMNFRGELNPVFKAVRDEVLEIKQGSGAMLANAKPIIEPIAIYYSANNWHASNLSSGVGAHINNLGQEEMWYSKNLGGRVVNSSVEFQNFWKGIVPAGHYSASSKSFINLLLDMNRSFYMLSKQQIEKGTLANFKVLVMPFVEALSDHEVELIKKFVADGGTLIADYRCGTRDEHCRIRKNGGALDEVFGIKQRDGSPVEPGKNSVIINYPRTACETSINFCQAGLSVTTGTAYGCDEKGAPVFIINKHGKGEALFCNFDINDYYKQRKKGNEEPVRELFRAFLRKHSPLPVDHPVRRTDGQLADNVRMFSFKDGNVYYYGIIKDFVKSSTREEDMLIPMLHHGHIYDVREKKYLGTGNLAQINLAPGKAKLLAVLPEKINAIVLEGPESIEKGNKAVIKLRVQHAKSPKNLIPSIVVVKVYNPNGELIPYMQRTLYLKNSSGLFELPIALNDKAGVWKVKLQDAISGKQSTFCIDVK